MISLKKNKDFSRVYRRGTSRADSHLVVYTLKRGDEERSRLGISVSKKVGNSVVRHRIKRRIKEVCRLNEDGFSTGCDYAVIARKSAAEADYATLERSLLRLMKS